MSDVREQLADYAHAAWSGWIDYMFSKCAPGTDGDEFADGSLVIPPWAVERWKRQAGTPYAQLPEQEKESDREEADRMLAIVARGPRPRPAATGGDRPAGVQGGGRMRNNEACEDCGATENLRGFGTDQTPLCPECYARAERNYEAAVRAVGEYRTWAEEVEAEDERLFMRQAFGE